MLFFINLLMIIFWLLMFNVMHTSYINIMKLLRITCTELTILFTHVWNFSRTAWAFKLIMWSAMFSLSSLQSDIIKFRCIINIFVISWKIWLIDLFYIFFIFFLFTIFIKMLRFLQSNDKLFLNHYFFIVTSSLTTLIYDDVLNVKCVFSCICSCLLRSWMNVFNFYTFFMINASWLSILFSEINILNGWISRVLIKWSVSKMSNIQTLAEQVQ